MLRQSAVSDIRALPKKWTENRRASFSSDLRLANEAQQIAIINEYFEPLGKHMPLADQHERGHYIRENSEYFRERLLQWYALARSRRISCADI